MSLLVVGFLATGCRPTIYLAPDFDKVARKHKTVAVLPFAVEITTKRLPKGVTPETIKEQEKSNGYSMQGDVYRYLLKEYSKDKYTVEFQDIDKTNAKLEEAGIAYEKIALTGKDKIAELLGVDAVLSGKIVQERPMSDGVAIAVGVVFGVWGNTNEVNAALNIHEKSEGKLLWKYDYVASGSVGTSTKSLSNTLMRNASKKFPYKKD